MRSLAGRLLLAMPTLADPNFAGSVILVCEHNAQGALGLVVNRPLRLRLGQILQQLDLPLNRPGLAAQTVFSGGPVETGHGFVVHEAPTLEEGSLAVGPALAVAASESLLAAIAGGEGPKRFLVALGYAGWGPGQLEGEFVENAWLDTPVSPELLFETPPEERWQRAAAAIGVDSIRLSGEPGHA